MGPLKDLRKVLIGLGVAVVLIYAIVIGSMYAECAVTPAQSGGLWNDVCDARAFWSMFVGGFLVAAILFVLIVVWAVAAARDKKKWSCPRCGYRVAENATSCSDCGYTSSYRSSLPPSPGRPPPPPPQS